MSQCPRVAQVATVKAREGDISQPCRELRGKHPRRREPWQKGSEKAELEIFWEQNGASVAGVS